MGNPKVQLWCVEGAHYFDSVAEPGEELDDPEGVCDPCWARLQDELRREHEALAPKPIIYDSFDDPNWL